MRAFGTGWVGVTGWRRGDVGGTGRAGPRRWVFDVGCVGPGGWRCGGDDPASHVGTELKGLTLPAPGCCAGTWFQEAPWSRGLISARSPGRIRGASFQLRVLARVDLWPPIRFVAEGTQRSRNVPQGHPVSEAKPVVKPLSGGAGHLPPPPQQAVFRLRGRSQRPLVQDHIWCIMQFCFMQFFQVGSHPWSD